MTNTDMDEKYPELTKLQAIAPKSQVVGEFLLWLESEKGLVLGRVDPEDRRLYPAFFSTETLLAEFFEVDLQKVEHERRAMLEEIRASNGY